MKRKAKGTRYELRSRDWLTEQGYQVARLAGSFGPFDLIAFTRREVLLVQVKCGRWPVEKEKLRMQEFPAPANFLKVIHRWAEYERAPRVMEL